MCAYSHVASPEPFIWNSQLIYQLCRMSRIAHQNYFRMRRGSRQLQKIFQRSTTVRQYITTRKVTWQFIVEKAPWWGAFGNDSLGVKNCLKKSVGRSLLDYEELRTLMVEIEAAINNCPLTYMYNDENWITYHLTPSDLIYDRQLSTSSNSRHFDVNSMSKTLNKASLQTIGKLQKIMAERIPLKLERKLQCEKTEG